MQLFGMGKSRSFRALWAVEELGLECEYIEVQFGKSEENGSLSEQYRHLNPQGKVPTLVDGELVLTETGAILNYLASKAPDLGLKPQDGTVERARYDEICHFIVTEYEQPLWTNGKHRFALPEQYRVPEVVSKTTHYEFEKAQSTLLKLIGDNEYAAGDKFTMADILLAHTISWAQKFEYEVEQSLLDYRDEMNKREACIRAAKRLG